MRSALAPRLWRLPDPASPYGDHQAMLTSPLRWHKAAAAATNRDLFAPDAPLPELATAFGVMLLTSRHQFTVSTNHPERMQHLLSAADVTGDGESLEDLARRCADAILATPVPNRARWARPARTVWPLPNVAIEVCAFTQADADRVVPLLMQTPAAARMLDCSPLLGPIDIRALLPEPTPIAPADMLAADDTWTGYPWPEWIPHSVRTAIEKFWSPSFARGPAQWLRSAVGNGAPPLGTVVTLPNGFHAHATLTTGRYVHAWNNIGRIVRDDGTVACTFLPPRNPNAAAQLGQITCGGQRGRSAAPTNPAWVRSLRDQAAALGSRFVFSGWGEWAPAPWRGLDGATHAFPGTAYIDRDGTLVHTFIPLDHSPTSIERTEQAPPGAEGMRKVGATASGRLLDGREHG